MFNKDFFEANPIYIIIIISFGCTICWVYAMALNALLLLETINSNSGINYSEIVGFAIYLGIPIMFGFNYIYYSELNNNSFKEYIEAIGLVLVGLLGLLIVAMTVVKSIRLLKKKKNKQLEIKFPE